MTNGFAHHDLDTVPEASRPLFKHLLETTGRNGFYAVLAESPQALEAYTRLHELFSATTLNNDEKTVVWQTINVENECTFCVPAHTFMARMMGVDDAISTALRDETPLPTARLEALRTFTLLVVRNRGFVEDEDVSAFLAAGFTHINILEIIVGTAQKTISNYVNHLAKTPSDEKYQQFAWTKANKRDTDL